MQGDNYKDIENRGWAGMKELLDQNMPVRRKIIFPVYWIFGSIAIFATLVWLVYPFNGEKEVLNKEVYSFNEHTASLNAKAEVPIDTSFAPPGETSPDYKKNANAAIASQINGSQYQSITKSKANITYSKESVIVKDEDLKLNKVEVLKHNEKRSLEQKEKYSIEHSDLDRKEFITVALLQPKTINQIEINPLNIYLNYPKIQPLPSAKTIQHNLFLELGYLGPLLKTNHGVFFGMGYRIENTLGFYTSIGLQYSFSSYRNSGIFDLESERASNDPSGEFTDPGTSMDGSAVTSITDENGIKAEYYSSAIGGVKNFHQLTVPLILGYQFNNNNSLGLGFYYSRMINIRQEFTPIKESQMDFNLSYAGLTQNNLSKRIYNINNLGVSLNYEYSITRNINLNLAIRSNLLPIIKTSDSRSDKDLFTATSLSILYKL